MKSELLEAFARLTLADTCSIPAFTTRFERHQLATSVGISTYRKRQWACEEPNKRSLRPGNAALQSTEPPTPHLEEAEMIRESEAHDHQTRTTQAATTPDELVDARKFKIATSLLSLPPELRLLIYYIVFADVLGQEALSRIDCYPLPPLLLCYTTGMDDVVEGFASWTLSDALSDMDVAHQRSLQQGLSTAKATPLDTPEREYQPIHSRSATQPNIPARNLVVYRTNMEESDPCFRAGTFCTDASLDVKWNNSKRCGRQATRDANLRLLHSITAPLQSNPEALINREAMLDWRRSQLGWVK
ncbi:hypothetical protein B0A48_11073 [Cryoendolithus antarcticus]|uniref:Uncharacterized protein n=1 Tax=Cryoendolithus antarcticus TaxID=1507870 RepID=A0A1V8SUR0_9PEZI|nr:hypothetical protein B0A48_11073 [Cryoendolithus antarcticus]